MRQLAWFTVERVVDAIYWFDPQGKLFYANAAASKMLGYSHGELMDMSVFDINPACARDDWKPTWEKVKKTGSLTRETVHQRKNGSLVPVEISINSLQYQDHEILCSFVRDITARHKSKERTRVSERQLREVQEHATEGIFRTDLEGNILYGNRAMARMIGFEHASELLNHNASDFFIHPEDREKLTVQLTLSGQLRDVEFPLRKLNGDTLWVRKTERVIRDENGEIQYIEGFILDITDRKLLESSTLKTQKMESIGVLAAGLAHDFNNFLASISLSISSVRFAAEDNEELQNMLDSAEQSIQRAGGIMRQLSTFSKDTPFSPNPSQLGPLVTESVNFALHGTDVAPIYHIDDDLKIVSIDQSRISQVLHNLTLNAAQAMPHGGRLFVTAMNHKIEGANPQSLPEGHYVDVIIEDEGIGIEPENLGKIFDPYYTSKDKGSGLGLFVSFNIISQHKGALFGTSVPGKGSVFTFSIPATDDPQVTAETSPDYAIPAERILVVESNDELGRSIEIILTKMGHTVDIVERGEEAIKQFEARQAGNSPCQLVMIDSRLKGNLDHSATFQQIRKIDPHIRGLLMSSQPNRLKPDEDQLYLENLVKPFSKQTLERALKRAFA
ncbi:MAG: PAS domain S-box protein [Candidatus Marinimicrobia bacterium]|nr:PAS domain S-box protein [Candidatus Neomarinimicrobiota bacterium]